MIVKGILLAFLLFLFYQDLRYRAVYWICFPLLLLAIIVLNVPHPGISTLMMHGGVNAGFFMLQLLIVTAYFSLKHRRFINITKQHLGWGDVLFLLVIGFYLSPLNYLMFYIFSLLIILMAVSFATLKARQFKIPLAGLQAIIFAAFLLTDWTLGYIDLVSDTWILTILNG